MAQDETFVNPYTFVPFPDVVPDSGAPAGHLGRGDLLSGKLVVTIDAETPLLIRGVTPQKDDAQPRLPCRPDGTAMIPGSSLKGALRSLHETLAGGCLRVFDGDFVPVYRDAAEPAEIGEVRMAVVQEHDDEHTPPVLQLCKPGDPRKHRLHHQDLVRLHSDSDPLISGARLKVEFDAESGKPTEATRSPQGEWVVFISDAKARDPQQPYRAHIRRLAPNTDSTQVPDAVWQRYLDSLVGARDLSTIEVNDRDAGELHQEVEFTHKPKGEPESVKKVGKRFLAGKRLQPGQPVWVQLEGKTITAVRHGMIWRHQGAFPAGQRIPPGLKACDDERNLCPSCQLFGSAEIVDETEDRASKAAEQHSYRGHIRVGDALVVGEAEAVPVTLPPMGKPRPGSGQFYLVNDASTNGNVATRPLREWGSVADSDRQPRRLRGRKFYWHTPLPDKQELPVRGQARAHHLDEDKKNSMVSKVVAFARGTRFSVTLTFTDLDEVQLGGLLAVLQPRSALEKPVWQHIGGGRPLGYGSCTLTVDTGASSIWRSGTRYGAAGDAVPVDIEAFVGEFRSWAAREAPGVHRLWRQVAEVLTPLTDEAGRVWYPPGTAWTAREGTDGGKSFDDGYEFWLHTSGAERKKDKGRRTGHPLTSLPGPADPVRSLKIVDEAEAVPIDKAPHPRDRKGGRR